MSLEIKKDLGIATNLGIAALGGGLLVGGAALMASFHGHFVSPIDQLALAVSFLGIIVSLPMLAYGISKSKKAWEENLKRNAEHVKQGNELSARLSKKTHNWIEKMKKD